MNDIKPEVGFGIMMLKDGKILLGKRNDDAKKADSELHGEGTWTMPGGKLHFQESFEQGAEREVLEETGIKLNKAKVIALNNDLAKDAHFVTIGLFSENFEGEAKVMEPEEITQWKWFDINNIPANLFPPSKKLLENYKSKLFYKEEISEEKMKIEEQIEKIKQEIQPYFKEVNPSHDFTHTERVMSLALRIGKKENRMIIIDIDQISFDWILLTLIGKS